MASRQRVSHLADEPDKKAGSRKPTPPKSGTRSGSSKAKARRGPIQTKAWTKAPIGVAGKRAARQAPKQAEAALKVRIAMLLAVVAVVLVGGWTTFTYLVPHTQVEVNTAYHASWSGKFVQTAVENKGTSPLTDVTIKLAIWNDTKLMNSTTETVDELAARTTYTTAFVHYYGDSVETFEVVVEVSFTTAGNTYIKTYSYEAKDYQNHNWNEEIFEWN